MRNAYLPLLKKLSNIQSSNGCAISFFYFPQQPQNRAHAEDRIRLKDILRDAKRRADEERLRPAKEDLDRLNDLVERFALNGTPVAVFACAEHGIWEQLEIPGARGESRMEINGRFHLRPLAEANGRNILVVLADRLNVRFLRLSEGGLDQFDSIQSDLPRKARTDGFGGYDAGHKERHVGNWEMRHFKEMGDKLKQLTEGNSFDGVVIVCRSEIRPELEPHLHTYVTDKLLGYIDIDPAMLSEAELREQVSRMDSEFLAQEQEGLIREVMGESQRNGRGALGLRKVLQSLEKGEVQTLVVGDGFSARVAECTSCGHLDTRTTNSCQLCSNNTREVDDVVDALTSRAMRSSLGIAFVRDDDFAKAVNIGALLRFRADQNTPAKLAS